jgi:hypothetical protein
MRLRLHVQRARMRLGFWLPNLLLLLLLLLPGLHRL